MHTSFNALVTRNQDGQVRSALEPLTTDRLSPGEVTLRTLYAGVNYKDCLSLLGKARIISAIPAYRASRR